VKGAVGELETEAAKSCETETLTLSTVLEGDKDTDTVGSPVLRDVAVLSGVYVDM